MDLGFGLLVRGKMGLIMYMILIEGCISILTYVSGVGIMLLYGYYPKLNKILKIYKD